MRFARIYLHFLGVDRVCVLTLTDFGPGFLLVRTVRTFLVQPAIANHLLSERRLRPFDLHFRLSVG